MDGQLLIAAVGFLSALAGVVGTLISQRWKSRAERDDRETDRLITYYTNELAYCRSRCEQWERLALQNLRGMEVAAEVIQEQRTEAPS